MPTKESIPSHFTEAPTREQYSAVRGAEDEVTRVGGFQELQQWQQGDIKHYAGTVAEYLVRRGQMGAMGWEDVGVLSRGLVRLSDVVDEAQALRDGQVPQRFLDAANLAAMAAVIEGMGRHKG